MTENAFSTDQFLGDEIAARATWNLNSLLEAGRDDLAADLAANYEAELRHLPNHPFSRASRHLRRAG